MPKTRILYALLSASALVLAPIATSLPVIGADAAYAKGGGGNGNSGGDNGNSGGSSKSKGESSKSKGGKSAGSSSSSKSKASGGKQGGLKAKAKTKTTKAKASPNVRPAAKPAKLNGKGSLASELKWLNAAHANPNAFANADPNSNVGRIGAYRDAYLAADTAQAELDAAIAEQTRLNGLTDEQIASEFPDADGIDTAAYEQAIKDAEAAGDANEVARLESLDATAQAEEFAASYDKEAYDEALADAGTLVTTETAEQAIAEDLVTTTLDAATKGTTLSPEAFVYFHELLGLPAPEVATEEVAEGTAVSTTP